MAGGEERSPPISAQLCGAGWDNRPLTPSSVKQLVDACNRIRDRFLFRHTPAISDNFGETKLSLTESRLLSAYTDR